MEHTSSWQICSVLTNSNISHYLWETKFYYYIHKSTSKPKKTGAYLDHYFFKNDFDVIFFSRLVQLVQNSLFHYVNSCDPSTTIPQVADGGDGVQRYEYVEYACSKGQRSMCSPLAEGLSRGMSWQTLSHQKINSMFYSTTHVLEPGHRH
jgi:hypothetical protein